MALELDGKSAVITGASRGIGAAAAVDLARNGVSRFFLHYGTYKEGAEETAAAVRDLGAEVLTFQADLTGSDGIQSLCREVKTQFPRVDILINNAGHLVERARLLDFTGELFDRVMNLNVKSMYLLTQAVAPGMIEAGSGVVVNLSSIAARNGGGLGATIYSASKAAVSTITKGLARELAPKGIRVNAVSPGTVDNYFHEKHSTREMLNSVIAQTPAGKLATNEEISSVILFLCSDASRYVHGQTIEINGGMYMV